MAKKSLPGSTALMVTGIAAILLGVVLLLSPAAVGAAVVRVVALALVLLGVAQLVHALRLTPGWPRLAAAVLGVVVTVVGMLIWVYPDIGSGILTILLVVFFAVNGVWKMVTGWRFRPLPGWAWLLVSGLLSMILAWLLWRQWPLSGAWAVGVLVGVELLFTGLALVAVAQASRRRQAGDIETINL